MRLQDINTIVLDACVGISAGNSSLAPESTNSRKILDFILKNGYSIICCNKLYGEWTNTRHQHSEKYSVIWFSQMLSAGRIKLYKSVTSTEQDIKELINRNASCFWNNRESKIQAAEKDAHLLNLAIISEKLIISNERNAAQLLNMS